MTTYCKIQASLVVNRTIFDGEMPEDWPDAEQWIPNEDAQIGWGYADGQFTAPELPLEPEPAPLITISKDAIWRRATDEEAELMENALQSQPVRLRRIYEGATFISTADELYGVLRSALEALFGSERAEELLQPTN